MRRLLLVLAVLLALAATVDRVAAAMAGRVVAEQLQASGELARAPEVSVRGFPFLTQAAAGRYQRIDFTARDLDRPGLSFARLEVSVAGARVPLRAALDRAVTTVPVESLRATAVIDYAEVARRSGLRGLSVTPADGGVRITGTVSVLGQQVRAATRSRLRLENGSVVVTAQSLELLGRSSALIDRAIAGRLDFRLDVPVLPYGLRLTGVVARDDGLAVTARSAATVLQQP